MQKALRGLKWSTYKNLTRVGAAQLDNLQAESIIQEPRHCWFPLLSVFIFERVRISKLYC